MEPRPSVQRKAWVRALGHAMQLTADLVGLTGALGAVGYFGFRELHWGPEWGALLGGTLGFSFAIYRVYARVNAETAEEANQPEGHSKRD